MKRPATEIRDNLHIDWDVPITMDDGLTLRADVFRPVDTKRVVERERSGLDFCLSASSNNQGLTPTFCFAHITPTMKRSR